MLEKPDLSEDVLITSAQEEFNLPFSQVIFLPLGYDLNTAVYRIETQDGTPYFLKLRKGVFEEIAVALPFFLYTQGLKTIIPPLMARSNRLWGKMGDYKLILYPFIEGTNGYETKLSPAQWQTFGQAMNFIHTVQIPPALLSQIPRETYSSYWRLKLKEIQEQVGEKTFADAVATRLAAFIRRHQHTISQVVERAGQLAALLLSNPVDFTLCHSDIHPGNLHITPDNTVYIVDWDNPLLAPKEHDLNLIGGGDQGSWRSDQEAELFYRGYGSTRIDSLALSYYRFERIVVDMAEFCKQLLLSSGGGEDREQAYLYFIGLFEPGADIELAMKNDI
jgi:spectinomycin phosphotransferase